MRIFFSIFSLLGLLTGLSACQATIDSGANPSGGGEAGTSTETSIAYQTPLRLGDRFYVSSVLTGLFIPDSVQAGSETTERNALVTNVTNLIQTQVEEFGAPQDIFLSFALVDDGLARRSQAQFAATNTALRAAFGLRAVYELVKPRVNEIAMRNIIGLTRGLAYNQVQISTLTSPTSEEIANIMGVALPGISPSATSLTALMALRDDVIMTSSRPTLAEKHLEAWRFIVIAVLSNMAWQVL